MADRVDRLPDDIHRQSRSHGPDVDRLLDESGGRNADALDSLDRSRMLHGELLSVSGGHERHHRTQWAGSLKGFIACDAEDTDDEPSSLSRRE